MDPLQKIEENLQKGEYKSALDAYKEALNAYTKNSQKLSQAEQKALYEKLKKEHEKLEEFWKTEKKTSDLYDALKKCKNSILKKDPDAAKKIFAQAEKLHEELSPSPIYKTNKQHETIESLYTEITSGLNKKKDMPKKNLDEPKKEPEKPTKIKKYMTGIPGLDKLFEEGIPEASSVLLEGGPGSGKTLLCLQMAYAACEQGRKVLYMSFEEPEERLKEHMRDFSFHPDEFEKQGLLKIKRFNALDISRSVEALLSEAKKELLIEVQPMLFPKDFNPDFLIVDSLTAIASAFSGEESRFRIYMEQLFRYLEKMKISSILIREVANPTHTGYNYVEQGEAVSFLSDGIIIVYNVFYPNGSRGSAIEILKMRGEAIDKRIVKMEIQSKKGITVYPNQQLTGNYRLT